MLELWDFLDRELSKGPVSLMVVTEHKGSAPGKRGFKMAFTPRGERRGTIGGGMMEFQLAQRARRMMDRGERGAVLVVQVHHDKAPEDQRSGMICAGSQRIALACLHDRDKDTVAAIRSALARGDGGCMVLTPKGLAYASAERGSRFEETASSWHYVEELDPPDTVYVVGSGHVGLAICKVLATQDFYIVALDDRPDVDTLRENVYAHQKIVGPYERIGEHIREGTQGFVVIVTTGFRSDAIALEQVIHKDLRYLGLMGSTAKIRAIFKHVAERGVDPRLFEKVHAPIGIPIHNSTPAEIGISVVAELIKVRNAR